MSQSESDRPEAAEAGSDGTRTFLIADIRGYTAFTQGRGDEWGARLAQKFACIMREGVEAVGGDVLELRGDEALCVFGSARRGLRAAVELQLVFADEVELHPELPLRVGMGLDVGEPVAVDGLSSRQVLAGRAPLTPRPEGCSANRRARNTSSKEVRMDMKLEVVPIPVSDVDAAKAFYTERVGFGLDHDVRPNDHMRVVQMTPPGSACSVVIGEGLPLGEPGSVKGVQLVVEDLDAVREALAARGVPVSDLQQLGPPGSRGSRFAFFDDPDGNTWAVQELKHDPA